MRIGVIIPAAGTGKRFGTVYKPFLKINNKTVLEIVLNRFLRLPNVREIVVVAKENYVDKVKRIISAKFNLTRSEFKNSSLRVGVVPGGKERKFSVYNAFKKLASSIDVVIIHDAVRPIFDLKLLTLMLKKIKYCNAIIPVKPISDTVKLIEDDYVKETVDRGKLFLSFTPQVFKKNILEFAYKKVNINKYMITDEAQLIEIAGKKVNTIIHSGYNVKITYPEDYEMVKGLLHKDDNAYYD